eukprot:CAMPEP_0206611134 /NCGR_PEP_ID=MMETSP0325_2-20121206/55050_1 /ASSEMBLY_ACC=CAM_ASM_000347 /TAXON_ID=2866 /ORGANISM="Crypthecodinium cohnii, Strain Seligo" /LENGTH=153 /DNA_ID=CAMNT_0054130251 /DNA_START=39 /DNA_END=501 /DNA_ORIENTATION=-
MRPWIPPAEPKNQHTSHCEPRQTKPQLLQEQSPDTMLLRSATNASILVIPRDVVPQVLRIADADVDLRGDEVRYAKFKEIADWRRKLGLRKRIGKPPEVLGNVTPKPEMQRLSSSKKELNPPGAHPRSKNLNPSDGKVLFMLSWSSNNSDITP